MSAARPALLGAALAAAICGSAAAQEPGPEGDPPPAAAPSSADGQRHGWKRKGASLSRGDLQVSLTGYLQADFRSFRNWEAGDEDTGILRSDGRDLRRLRVGLEARWKRLSAELDLSVREDALNLVEEEEHTNDERVKDAYAELRVSKGLRVRAGNFKLPLSREFLTSASRLDFVERTLLATHIGPARDVGLMLHGEPLGFLAYQVGLFAGDGRVRHDRAETTGAARLVLTPVKDLEAGVSFSQGRVEADAALPGVELRPKGVLGEGPAGFVFYERHFVHGRRRRLGAEAQFQPGPWSLRAELLQAREQRRGQGSLRDDLPDQVATGWAGSVSVVVLGQRRKGRVAVRRPLFGGGAGALEVGVRLEELRFDDSGPDAGFAGAGTRARNIRLAADRVITGGVSWWPSEWVRLMGNVVVERFEDALLAPEPGRQGDYVTLLARVQFQVP